MTVELILKTNSKIWQTRYKTLIKIFSA